MLYPNLKLCGIALLSRLRYSIYSIYGDNIDHEIVDILKAK